MNHNNAHASQKKEGGNLYPENSHPLNVPEWKLIVFRLIINGCIADR